MMPLKLQVTMLVLSLSYGSPHHSMPFFSLEFYRMVHFLKLCLFRGDASHATKECISHNNSKHDGP